MISTKRLALLLYFIILLIFCYFRLRPIYFQTIPYTFDQGRDFLKAADIATGRDLAFIGPTTGIGGLYHGVWWYYLLALTFLLSGGLPQGFYIAVFIIQLVSFIGFTLFVKKYFDLLTTLILASLIATSSYFISVTLLAANNVLVIPFLILFLGINFYLLESKVRRISTVLFLAGFSLAMIVESELAFGFLIIPTYILLVVIFPALRKYFSTAKNLLYFFFGFIIPVIPRILFELKHFFPQTKALLRLIIAPTIHTPKAYNFILQDRLNTFFEYYRSIFPHNALLFMFTLAFIVISITRLTSSNKIRLNHSKFLSFLVSFLLILFFLSTLYKDTFWSYYLEGLPYVFLTIIAFTLSIKIEGKDAIVKSIKIVLFVATAIVTAISVRTSYEKRTVLEGLRVQQTIVDYIAASEKNEDRYCVKVYTAPVIPYTYNYLFFYNNHSKNLPIPKTEWVNNKCWYIVEDDYAERRFAWREQNIPKDAHMEKDTVVKDVHVELWKK